ncbi:MAG: hypothetical protein VB050_18225 [Geobacteraceae bacterium]|nr:hypothetical protein [Geobacteraceae bacterium]
MHLADRAHQVKIQPCYSERAYLAAQIRKARRAYANLAGFSAWGAGECIPVDKKRAQDGEYAGEADNIHVLEGIARHGAD